MIRGGEIHEPVRGHIQDCGWYHQADVETCGARSANWLSFVQSYFTKGYATPHAVAMEDAPKLGKVESKTRVLVSLLGTGCSFPIDY